MTITPDRERTPRFGRAGYWRLAAGIAALVLLAPMQAAQAQTQLAYGQTLQQLQKLSIEQLSQLQVTSVAKRSESLSDAPAAIYVITHDDIIRSGATTIPEILRLAPNLEVAQINATSYAISARGFNVGDNASLSNKLLVLVDGRSVYTPMFGGVYWDMLDVLPQNIARIEVISGPGAALWGANAVNGVINIITRNSDDTEGGLLTLGAGTLERSTSIQYGGRLSPTLTYRVHAAYSAFDSYPLPNGQSAHDSWSKPQGGFRLDWQPPNNAVSLQGDLFTANQQPNSFIRGNDLMTTWRHDFDDGSNLQLLAYYNDAERSSENGGGFKVRTYDIELQHNFHIGSWNDIVWGAGERLVQYHFYTAGALLLVPPTDTLNLANVFAQDTIALAPRLKLTLGLKLEDEPYAGLQVMPSARLAWKVTPSALLWAAVSRAVRSPTPVDTGIREYGGTVDFLNGSRGFRPETLTAYEIGARVQPTQRLSFSVSGYYDVYDKLRSIDASPTPNGLPLVFGNLMAGQVFGIEVWGNYQLTSWWRLTAGFSLLHQDLRFLPGSLTVAGLAFVSNDPGHQASLRSSMNLGHGVTLDGFLREVGALQHPSVPGYVELNMRLGWQATQWLNLSLSGFNLLHPRHVEFLEDGESTAIPRSVFAQAQIRF